MDRDNQRDKPVAMAQGSLPGLRELFAAVERGDYPVDRDERLEEIRRKHSMHVYEGYEDDVQGVVGFLLKELDRLQGERDKAIEGLRWYADRSNYQQPKPFYMPYVEADKGEHARSILKELGQ